MLACTVSRMKSNIITKLFLACTLALSFAACTSTNEAPAPEQEFVTSMGQSTISCTPGAQTCDYGCAFDGSNWDNPTPTTDDCIIRCNAAGNAWTLVENCGWAQNFPYSSSCLNSQPQPVCQNN